MTLGTRDGHELRRLYWRLRQRLMPPGRRVVHARGLQFTLQADNWMTHYRWQSYNDKEPETLEWIDAWVKDGDVVFDIGANIGVYTVYAALRHPRARVVAFEPEYANLHLLRDNVLENRLQDRVEVYAVALSRRSGLSRLHLQDLTPGTALHVESSTPVPMTPDNRPVLWREGVYALTLDAFCEETGLVPTCVKMDVDGAEPGILAGAARTLHAPKLRSIILEMPRPSEAYEACERRLVGAGFRRQWRDPQGRSQNEIWVRDAA